MTEKLKKVTNNAEWRTRCPECGTVLTPKDLVTENKNSKTYRCAGCLELWRQTK